MKRVLVAYDGSAPARRALAHAAELARPGDAVTVVNVMPEPGVGARIEPPIDERNRQWCLLDEARHFLAVHGVEARTMAPVGDTAREILAAAAAVRADVIVVARHRGHRPHPLGSITGRLVRSAGCDVLLVHEASAEPGADDEATATPG
ncbi:MAG: universal stress protein [Solirubrobacteraceae bacterium]